MSHREIAITRNKASNSACQPANEIVHLPDHHPLLGGFPSVNYCFFCNFKALSVSVNGACFLCCKQSSNIYFPKPVVLKLCYVRKFGYKEYQRVIKDKCWFCSVLGSLQTLSSSQETSLSYRSLSRCFS